MGAACALDPPEIISNSAMAKAARILAACDTRDPLLEPSPRPPPRRLERLPLSVPGVFPFLDADLDDKLLFAVVEETLCL